VGYEPRRAPSGSATDAPADDERYHRQWLHAMEADPTVPGTVMQVARVYADYAASRGGRSAGVSYPTLIRQTHRSRDALAEAHEWMTAHGWLRLRPAENGDPWRDGQRKTYDLTTGRPGEKRKPVRLPERSGDQNRSGSRTGLPYDRSGYRTGSAGANRSGRQTATSPVAGTEPVRLPERERLTSVTSSLSRRTLHDQFAVAVPGVTERETAMVLELIGRRPRVESPAAVMIHEIGLGLGPALVAAVREPARPAPDSADHRPSGVRYADQCPRCSRVRHEPLPCPDLEPAANRRRAIESPPPLASVPPGDSPRCLYAACGSPAEPIGDDEYHVRCRHLNDIKARAAKVREHPEAS